MAKCLRCGAGDEWLEGAVAPADPTDPVTRSLNLGAMERTAILAALRETRWNKLRAARMLGIHRPTLYARMRRHGIGKHWPGQEPRP